MKLRWLPLCAWCLLLAAGHALAQGDEARQRRQIAEELAAATARLEQEKSECRQRFALNNCLDAANARHRQTQSELQARQRTLDERRRVDRALERQAEVARKQQLLDQRLAGEAAPAQALTTAAEGQASTAVGPSRSKPRSRISGPQSAAAAASERAAAARRLQADIKADQQRIEARLARREAQGKKSKPLPAAGASSAAP